MVVAIPAAYALARWRFRGRILIDALLDIPIVLSPIVIGIALILVFRSPPGKWIEDHLVRFVFEVPGIVIAQFVLALAMQIRVLKAGFEDLNPRYEQVARFMGCTPFSAFWRVTLPMCRSSLIAAFVMGWSRALSDFGATVTIAGSVRNKTETIPIAIYNNLASVQIGKALGLALLLTTIALCVLVVLRVLCEASRAMIAVRSLVATSGPFRLQPITLEIESGELLVLLGPSGTGKTVLSEALLGLRTVERGAVTIDGRDVTAIEPEDRLVAYMPQDVALFPHLSVRANIEFGRRVRGQLDGLAAEIADVSTALEISHLLDRTNIRSLSGGEAQRVALARALVTRPRVLFLDESFSALDAHIRRRLLLQFRQVQRTASLTAIYVTIASARRRSSGIESRSCSTARSRRSRRPRSCSASLATCASRDFSSSTTSSRPRRSRVRPRTSQASRRAGCDCDQRGAELDRDLRGRRDAAVAR